MIGERTRQSRKLDKARLIELCSVIDFVDFKHLLWISSNERGSRYLKCKSNRYKYPPRAWWFRNSFNLMKTLESLLNVW